MENFENVLEIFAERFSQFFPEKEDAKVLFSLYVQNKQKPDKFIFSESEVRELIRKHYKIDNETEKEQRKKFFDRLQRLLSSNFLERSTERQYFLLSDYSNQLCVLFFQKIEPLLNPSEIERTLHDVLLTLKANSSEIELFKHWFEKDFKGKLKAELSNQTNALEFQIKNLKDDLSEKNKSMDFLEFSKYITDQMDIVIENSKKLSKAFDGLDSISDSLSDCSLNKSGDYDFLQIKSNLNEMLNIYRHKLDKSSEEISRIKGIASNLFDIIDKKPFYRKFETFFFTVLENSSTNKISTRKDKEQTLFFVSDIKLPDFIEDIEILRDMPSEFLFPEYYENFSDSKNLKTEITERNQEKLNDAVRKSILRRHQADRIEFWLSNLREQINEKGELDYADFYLEMLHQEQDLEIAIKGTEHIMKTIRKEKFTVETTNEFSFNSNQPNNAIWNIKIKKYS
jgi:hypothetical protein